jgi:hypothetical protein
MLSVLAINAAGFVALVDFAPFVMNAVNVLPLIFVCIATAQSLIVQEKVKLPRIFILVIVSHAQNVTKLLIGMMAITLMEVTNLIATNVIRKWRLYVRRERP